VTADPRSDAVPYVRARIRNNALLTLVGLALTVGGFGGFGVFGSRSDALATHGVHTTATVVDTALYGGGHGSNQFNEHIDVAFTTPQGAEHARLWISEQARYSVGQTVDIVYDPEDPGHAQLAKGADLGPIGLPLFIAIVLGVCLAGVGIARLRVCRGARRALRSNPQRLEVASGLMPRGRTTARAVFVGSGAPLVGFWSLTRSGWGDATLAGSTQADVYGDLHPGSVLVVVADRGRGVAVGRTWRRHRLRRAGRRTQPAEVA
jgi:Protein of unknown function (DUF3592)